MKTESAIGMTIRAIANNHKVLFTQFLKDGSSSEIEYLKDKAEVLTSNTKGIVLPKNKTVYDSEAVLGLYNEICKRIATDGYDLVVLDEFLVALDMEMISITLLKRLISICKTHDADMYMTGRVRDKRLRNYIQEISDCITNAYCVKHMYDTYCENCKRTFPYHYTYCPDCGKQLQVSRPSKLGRDY
jgi:cob(I)alamin adenosyltransferase